MLSYITRKKWFKLNNFTSSTSSSGNDMPGQHRYMYKILAGLSSMTDDGLLRSIIVVDSSLLHSSGRYIGSNTSESSLPESYLVYRLDSSLSIWLAVWLDDWTRLGKMNLDSHLETSHWSSQSDKQLEGDTPGSLVRQFCELSFCCFFHNQEIISDTGVRISSSTKVQCHPGKLEYSLHSSTRSVRLSYPSMHLSLTFENWLAQWSDFRCILCTCKTTKAICSRIFNEPTNGKGCQVGTC